MTTAKSKINWKEIRRRTFIGLLVSLFGSPLALFSFYLVPANTSTGDEGYTMGIFMLSVSAWFLISLINTYLERNMKSVLNLLFFVLTVGVIIFGLLYLSQLSHRDPGNSLYSDLTARWIMFGLFASSAVIGLARTHHITGLGFSRYFLMPSIAIAFQMGGSIITLVIYMVTLAVLATTPLPSFLNFLPFTFSLVPFVAAYWFVITFTEETV